MLLKNGWVTALDVGGRLLAPGETGDLDETTPPVAEHLAAGRLVPIQGVAVEPGPDLPVPRQTRTTKPTEES